MVASTGGIDFWRASKFTGADDDGLVEQLARAQLADERGKGGSLLVLERRQGADRALWVVGVVVDDDRAALFNLGKREGVHWHSRGRVKVREKPLTQVHVLTA